MIVLVACITGSTVNAYSSEIIEVTSPIVKKHNNIITVAALADQEIVAELNDPPPVAEDEMKSRGDVFGHRYGKFHAQARIKGEWTDNLYNVTHDQEDNLLTTYFAGLAYTTPERNMRPLHIALNNTSPGGLQFAQPHNRFYNKSQFYVGGHLEYRNYSLNSDLNMLAGDVEGMAQYNPSPKLSFILTDKFAYDQDQFNRTNATSDNQRIYGNNLFLASAAWQISSKFATTLSYDNYTLVYDNDINGFLDRADHGFDFYFYYDYSPKTNFFVEYRIIQSVYDEQDQGYDKDSTSNYLFGGINWQSSVSTSFSGKAGYQDKTYDSDQYQDQNNKGAFAYQLQWDWLMTDKSSLLLKTTYSTEETDTLAALFKSVWSNRLGFTHRFTNRLRGDMQFIYENSDYDLLEDLSRTDDRYFFDIGLQFAFYKWLSLGAAYTFDMKDSNIDLLDYETNYFQLMLTGKI